MPKLRVANEQAWGSEESTELFGLDTVQSDVSLCRSVVGTEMTMLQQQCIFLLILD